ncbi:MAG: hypothetical protein IIV71_04175 [Bacteroidaceae bacterium]|nr:hypothetical protein [Bacteroidaceae bacterium]
MALQNALAFLKTEKWLCKMRWHFSKLKNGFAKCAGISQNWKMALQNALAFLKTEKWLCKMR